MLILAVSLSVTSVLLLTALGRAKALCGRPVPAPPMAGSAGDVPGPQKTTGGLPPVTGNSLREITLDDMRYLGQHQPSSGWCRW